jgi:hypothetical protein
MYATGDAPRDAKQLRAVDGGSERVEELWKAGWMRQMRESALPRTIRKEASGGGRKEKRERFGRGSEQERAVTQSRSRSRDAFH